MNIKSNNIESKINLLLIYFFIYIKINVVIIRKGVNMFNKKDTNSDFDLREHINDDPAIPNEVSEEPQKEITNDKAEIKNEVEAKKTETPKEIKKEDIPAIKKENETKTPEVKKPKQRTLNEVIEHNAKQAPLEIKKTRFKFQVVGNQGITTTGYIDASSMEEVKNYLTNEGYEVKKIEPMSSFWNMQIGGTKLKYSELAFILTQLSTYLKAGIPLIDAIRILEKQSSKQNQKRLFSNITFELVKGESFSNALAAQGSVFPQLLINMIKTAELTGDLPAILDDMTEYYTAIDRTRKQVISSMTYPLIIFIFSLMVLTFILVYVIPQFVSLFQENNADLPLLTRVVIGSSDFITQNAIFIIPIIIAMIIGYSVAFKYLKRFRKTMQTLYMKLPIVGNVIIYKEVAMFTKTFASLLSHDVFITDSMAILSTVSTNEVFKDIIDESLEYLSRGAKISDSFKGKWAFPVVAYEMLVTGENTGKLPLMMDYVAKYYEDLHANMTKRLNTFIEPLMIMMLAIIVGIVVLSVIIPMFSFYSQIK